MRGGFAIMQLCAAPLCAAGESTTQSAGRIRPHSLEAHSWYCIA
jgi:hypothetical protein